MPLTTSIAMTTYNGEKYLQEQLDSFCIQTVLPGELVVVDDCSNDKTIDILTKFKEKAPFPVKIIQNTQNIGSKHQFAYSKNFDTAIRNCNNDIVFLSDQDDVWFKNKIEEHLKVFNHNPTTVLVVNNAIRTDCNLKPGLLQTDYMKITCNGNTNVAIGCCFSMRRDFLSILLPLPDFTAHDNVINNCSIPFGIRTNIGSALQFFRRFPSTLSSRLEYSDCITKTQCVCTRIKRLLDFFIKKNKCLDDFNRFYNISIHLGNKQNLIKSYLKNINMSELSINESFTKVKSNLNIYKQRKALQNMQSKKKQFFAILKLFLNEKAYNITLLCKDILIMLYN